MLCLVSNGYLISVLYLQLRTSHGCVRPWNFFENIGSTFLPWDSLESSIHILLVWDNLQGCFRFCDLLSLWCLIQLISHYPLYIGPLWANLK